MLTAVEFFTRFVNSVTETSVDKDGNSFWDIYKNDKSFTDLVNKSLIHEIIENSGLAAQHEYFRIDTIGWAERYLELDETRAKEVGLNRHLWDLKIAVEHENAKADWMDEVIKLVHVRCPLKVVIGYNHCDQREVPERAKLAYVAECMQMIEAFHTADTEEYLIILGNGVPKDSSNPSFDRFDYRGYLYNHQSREFERLV